MEPAVAAVIAVIGITLCVTVFRLDRIPVGKVSIDLDSRESVRYRDWADPLVAPDVFRHLHVVIISIPALHGLNRTVEFRVVLIDKEIAALPTHELSAGSFRRRIFPCYPLVPVINVNELWIGFDRFIPSLLKIDAVALRVLHGFSQPGYISRDGQIMFVQGWLPAFSCPGFSNAG